MADSLRGRAQAFGFADKIGQILIPTEEVVEVRGGKKVTSKRMMYPGYVLVEMEMNDDLWHAVKNTPRVTGFVGGGNTPVPLSATEVNDILYRQATSAERPRPKQTFEKGGGKEIGTDNFTIGQPDFSAQVTKIAGVKPQPDCIYVPMFPPDIGIFLKQLRAAGVTSHVIGADVAVERQRDARAVAARELLEPARLVGEHAAAELHEREAGRPPDRVDLLDHARR